jgi:solute carrier family 25 phosphate transporter 3
MNSMPMNRRTHRIAASLLIVLSASNIFQFKPCLAFQVSLLHAHRRTVCGPPELQLSSRDETNESLHTMRITNNMLGENHHSSMGIGRRELLISIASSAVLLPIAAQALEMDSPSKTLEDLQLGKGSWEQMDRTGRTPVNNQGVVIPASFATYTARFLINYDESVASWWRDLVLSYALLSDEQQKRKLGKKFGSLAASVQLSLDSFVKKQPTLHDGYAKLLSLLLEKYNVDDSAERHIGILCAMLPKDQQPLDSIRGLFKSHSNQRTLEASKAVEGRIAPSTLAGDLTSLLPDNYGIELEKDGSFCVIQPPIRLYEVGLDEEFGQAAITTAFGPLSSEPLIRQMPEYSVDIYALFGISGATGCALTHSVVLPLDVVKTKAQTDPEDYSNIFAGFSRIVEEEGMQGLFTGAQATLAGYTWYGLSVYPSYTFFKRLMGQSLFPADFAVAHSNEIAVVAGALAAVIASLGLTPLEAARIRVVADPERYKPLGLLGTLDYIAKEDSQLGWKAVYAGLPSLMTRQIIFGSVKFLAFERACEAIYTGYPFLRDATWTALTVSLLAGGFSGALSSVVSQPADAVLTYVAQRTDGKGTVGVIEGCQLMIEESGTASLFRGLGSRCVWAGSIIAGQFLLYDVFRDYFGVNAEDLSQVFHIDI